MIRVGAIPLPSSAITVENLLRKPPFILHIHKPKKLEHRTQFGYDYSWRICKHIVAGRPLSISLELVWFY